MKKIKMVIYGEPGVGKSVFASKAPNPFFICTDGNYEWLEDWGAKEEDHVQIFSWEQAKEVFQKDFSGYDTIVVDLTEDLFKWCEYEWCQKSGLQHVGDLGYGKGYDITRNEFFIEISKLLNLDKNVILIMHGMSYVVKDRRGVEYTKYGPTNRLPDKLINMIEGRVRYFVRAFAKTEEEGNGDLITKRYLSLSPDGTTEFGITRGLPQTAPRYIPLDWESFVSVVMSNSPRVETAPAKTRVVEAPIPQETKPTVEDTVKVSRRGRKPKSEATEAPVEQPTNKEEFKSELQSIVDKVKASLNEPDDEDEEPSEPEPKVEEVKAVEEVKKVEEPVQAQTNTASETVSGVDKIAAIKAKLAALKNNK